MASKTKDNCVSILKNVFVYWKILGLCPFVLTEDTVGRLSYGGTVYTTIVTLVYCYFYYRAVENRMHYTMARETPMIVIAGFIGLSTECFLVITVWFCLTFRHDRLQTILTMFKKIQETSRTIEISQDFRMIFRTIKVHTIVMNMTWGILYICDPIFVFDNDTFNIEIWLPFNFLRIVSHNVVLMFVDVLWIIDKFFCSLNEKVRNHSRDVSDRPVIPRRNRNLLKNASLQPSVMPCPLEVYGQIHSDLVTLTNTIVEFFSISIILVMLVHFILMTSDLYILGLLTRDQNFFSWKLMGIFTNISIWWFFHLMESMTIIAVSDATANEANETGRALHVMLTSRKIKNYAESNYSQAQILSLRLWQRYMNIELYGFQVRLHVIYKIIGTMLTYVTIMMQLDIQNQLQQKMQETMIESNVSHVG